MDKRDKILSRDAKCSVMKRYQESGKKHLLITGSKGIGKSTLLREVLKDECSYGGIITRLIYDSNKLPSYVLLEDALNSVKATKVGVINSSGTAMNPIIEGFEELGTDILRIYRNSNKELIIFDEIGYIESQTVKYREEIHRCFREKRVLAVLRKSSSSFLNEIKSVGDALLIDLDGYL